MIYRLTWWFCQFLFRLVIPRRLTGVENVPRTGPVLLASNHISFLDPPVVGTGPWRPFAYMAKEELFHHRFFGWYISKLNAFPVKRGSASRGSGEHGGCHGCATASDGRRTDWA